MFPAPKGMTVVTPGREIPVIGFHQKTLVSIKN